jgi:hypothetical protein
MLAGEMAGRPTAAVIVAARREWWVAAPAAVGVVALVAILTVGGDPIVYLRGPLGELLAIAGVLVSLALVAALARR